VATQYVSPERAETLRFLELLEDQLVTRRVPVKAPDLRRHDREDLLEALRLLQNFAGRGTPLFVPGLDRYQMACQLGCRVYDLGLLGQGDRSLCGPYSFVYALARTSIAAYVELAIDLLADGRARINDLDPHLVITVAGLQHLAAHQSTRIDDVDLVVFGSLRSSVGATHYFIDQGADIELGTGYTTAPQLVRWLQHAGYADVADHTLVNFRDHHPTVVAHYQGQENAGRHLVDFGNRAPEAAHLSVGHRGAEAARRYSRANASLRMCQAMLAQGYMVFILHDSRLSELALGRAADAGGFDPRNLHWALVNGLRTAGRQVQVDLLTWGQRSDINRNLGIDRFLEYWGGFVAARP
jgi:hypothetical protein